MKSIKYFTIVIILSIITSCSTIKENREVKKNNAEMVLPQEEIDRFSIDGSTILYDGLAVAVVQSTEWEYTPNEEMRMEISLTQLNTQDSHITKKLLKYVHYKHPSAKVEVNFDK